MALYCIGDIQGCSDALERLLAHIGFSPSRDTVYLLGDLVNRGPDSAAVLRRCMRLDGALRPLLGNHDLHLLAAAHGTRRASRRDTLTSVLDAPDRNTLLGWLCQQPLARAHLHAGERLLMVHAGLLPAWSADDTLALAEEVQAVLRGPGLPQFLQAMYGNQPDRWHDGLQGMERLRVIVNALTRLRFCSPAGVMDFDSTESAAQGPCTSPKAARVRRTVLSASNAVTRGSRPRPGAFPSMPWVSISASPSTCSPPQMPSTALPCAACAATAWSSPCWRSQARSAAVDLEPGSTIQSAPAQSAGVRAQTRRTPGTFLSGWNSSRLLMRG